MSHVIQRSCRTEPSRLLKDPAANGAGALEIALLDVCGGEDGVALHARAEVPGMAHVDRACREPLGLAGAVEVTERSREMAGQPALVEVDPGRVFRRIGLTKGSLGVRERLQAPSGVAMTRVGACLHGGQHRADSWSNRTLGTCPSGGREVDPVPDMSEVKGLMAHGGEDAATECPIVGRMRQAERLGHVALGKPRPGGVVGHPADAEREVGGGAAQCPADQVGESSTKKRSDLATKVLHRGRQRRTATTGVINCLEVASHHPDLVNICEANAASADVSLDFFIGRSDKPSQGDIAGNCHCAHGTKELAAVQVAPPELDECSHRAIEIISPLQAVLGSLERLRG